MGFSIVESIRFDATLADSTIIDMRSMDGGRYGVPSGSSLTSVTWHESFDGGTTFVAAYDENGSAVVQTVAAARSYPIPYSLNASVMIKGVGNVDQVCSLAKKQSDSQL